jgi:predicted metal-dependent hydrolase
VSAQREWIENATRDLPPLPQANLLPESIRLPAIDRCYAVLYGEHFGRSPVAEQDLVLRVKADRADPSAGRRQLRCWLAAKARATFEPRLAEFAGRYGFRYQKLSVRGQRTRWGSCSSRGQISINYKLLFLEPELGDYLLIHELAHTRHMNHSARYWREVERCLPEYREREARMREAWKKVPGWVEVE